ncbi:MAG: LytR/AlgR family response regulator transcription factor [Candidatus Dormibacteria bacterium]
MSTSFCALVVDDEPPAREELAYLLHNSPRVREVVLADSASQCLDILAQQAVDVLFLDIRMPGLDGLQLSQLVAGLPVPVPVVFVTAFETHAVDAFQTAAFDYLLKPVRPERLNLTLERLALQRAGATSRGDGAEGRPISERLAVTHRGQILMLPLQDIRVAEVDGDRVALITHQGRYLARLRLRDLEGRLSRQGFLRVHRHYLVNLNHVTEVECFVNSTYLLRVQGLADLPVPVSRRHGAELRLALGL